LTLPTQCEWIYFLDLTQLKDLPPLISSREGKKLSQPTPHYQFLPFIIEIFGCLQKHVDLFLHDYANAIWSLKGPKGSCLSALIIFLCQKVSITLPNMQVSSILSRAIAIDLTTS